MEASFHRDGMLQHGRRVRFSVEFPKTRHCRARSITEVPRTSSCFCRSIKRRQITSLSWREEVSGDTTELTQKRCRCIDKHANVALHARQPRFFLCRISRASLGSCSSNQLGWITGRSPWSLVLKFAHSFIFFLVFFFSLRFEVAPFLSRLFACTNDRLMSAFVVTWRCDRARSAAGRTRSASFRGKRENKLTTAPLGFLFFFVGQSGRVDAKVSFMQKKKKKVIVVCKTTTHRDREKRSGENI